MGPRGRFYPYLCILHILDCLGQDMQVLYLGRAPYTKEVLPDFLKWRRVTRPPLVFRGLTGSQRTPGFWGVTWGIRSGLLWCEPGNKGEASELRSPVLVLIFPFSDISPLLPSGHDCSSRPGAVPALCL